MQTSSGEGIVIIFILLGLFLSIMLLLACGRFIGYALGINEITRRCDRIIAILETLARPTDPPKP